MRPARRTTPATRQRRSPDLADAVLQGVGHERHPRWSPDGTKFAFVSNRVDHSFIGVYDVRARTRDLPVAERRSRHEPDLVARRQAHRVHPPSGHAVRHSRRIRALAASAIPNGPAYNPLTALRGGRRGRRRREAAGAVVDEAAPQRRRHGPGLYDAAFAGGYTMSFWVADVATGDGKEFWHNAKGDKDCGGHQRDSTGQAPIA